MKLAIFTAVLFLLYGFGFGNSADKSFTLSTASGYDSETLIYMANGTEKDITVVAVHGKSAIPDQNNLEKLYGKLNQRGYTVIALTMPWSKNKREGTFEQAMEVIDKAVVHSGKQKVVVLGHSMGGMAVLQYGGRNPASQVIAIIPIAPAHDPHIAKKLRNITADSVNKAKKMVADGEGKDKARFVDLKSSNKYWFKATAEHYVSFYDPDSLPSLKITVPKIKLPVFWVVGTKDKLTQIYRMKEIYQLLPGNSKSRFLEKSESHSSVVYNTANDIADWLDKF